MNDAPGAKHASGFGMKAGGKSSGVGASGIPKTPTSASTATAEHLLNGNSFAVSIQTATAAKKSDVGGGGTVGADVAKPQEPGSPQQEESAMGVVPKEEAEGKDSASGVTNNAPGAEQA